MHILTFISLSLFVSFTINGYLGIGVQSTAVGVTARIAALLGSLGLDIFGIIQFTALARLLYNAV